RTPRKTHHVSYSSMRLMPWDVNGVLDWVEVMMNVNKPSTNCSLRWMVLGPTKVSSLLLQRTVLTFWTLPFSVRDVSIDRFLAIVRMQKVASKSLKYLLETHRWIVQWN